MELTRKGFILSSAAVAVAGCGSKGVVSAERKEGCGMLKGISPVVSPDLLKTLAEMGHGDEIVFSDAHFPAHTFGRDGAIVLTGETRKYGNIILKKGVTPVA